MTELTKIAEALSSPLGQSIIELIRDGLRRLHDEAHRANRANVLLAVAEQAIEAAEVAREQADAQEAAGQVAVAQALRIRAQALRTRADELARDAGLYEHSPAAVIDDLLEALIGGDKEQGGGVLGMIEQLGELSNIMGGGGPPPPVFLTPQ